MFRRLESSLPRDFIFPDTMEGMGYFINSEDRVASIEEPEKGFHYWCSKNERYLERHKESMSELLRKNVLERLTASTMEITRLPLGTPANSPHVPILTSKNLAECKRCVVYIGQPSQDLGVLANRLMDAESIAAGSLISLIDAVHKTNTSTEHDGIVVANPGQLVWYRRGKKAVTYESWYNIPRRSAVSPSMTMGEGNKIPRNHDPEQHIQCFFEDVVLPLAKRGCKLNIISVGAGAIETINYLQKDWPKWKDAVQAVVVGSGHVWDTEFFDDEFMEFWGKRARAYIASDQTIGTPLTGRQLFGCNIYASGELHSEECIIPRAGHYILDYFKVVNSFPNYENPPQEIEDPDAEPVDMSFGNTEPAGGDEPSDVIDHQEEDKNTEGAAASHESGQKENGATESQLQEQEKDGGKVEGVAGKLADLSIKDEEGNLSKHPN